MRLSPHIMAHIKSIDVFTATATVALKKYLSKIKFRKNMQRCGIIIYQISYGWRLVTNTPPQRVGVGGWLCPSVTARSKPSCLEHSAMQGAREVISPSSVYAALLRHKPLVEESWRQIEQRTPCPPESRRLCSRYTGKAWCHCCLGHLSTKAS